jgi:hypothetical protein
VFEKMAILVSILALAAGCATAQASGAHGTVGSVSLSKASDYYGTGTLVVRTNLENAELFVDDAPYGSVPGGQQYTVPADIHTVKVTCPGYEPLTTRVLVTRGNTHMVVAILKPLAGAKAAALRATPQVNAAQVRMGSIRVLVDVPVSISIDGVAYGDLPASNQGTTGFTVPVGEHQVVLKGKGYKDFSEDVNVTESISPLIMAKMEAVGPAAPTAQ